MPYKDLHDEPFGASTIAKLEIFEDYAQAWIPTWVMLAVPAIRIVDFFAGTGYDKNGIPGSPIRILKKLNEQASNILSNNVKVYLDLNEIDTGKYDQLKISCENFLDEHLDLKKSITLTYFNEDFADLFPKLRSKIDNEPSLIFLDQNGIKALSEKYFLELAKTRQTDFLYFVSASYFWRFGEMDEFKNHLDIDLDEAKKNPYRFIHRSLIEQLRAKLPPDSNLKLYPFSLKKGANIHGIIFGATHPRAAEKFIGIAWKRDEISGEANFDINEESKKVQGVLFGPQPMKKVEGFQQRVREKVMAADFVDNFQVFNYCLEEAHLGKHASDELKRMKADKLIDFEGNSPLVTYEKVYKEKRICKYTILKK